MDYERVRSIAEAQGMSEIEFRLACLRAQVEVMEERGCTNREQREWLIQIRSIIHALEGSDA